MSGVLFGYVRKKAYIVGWLGREECPYGRQSKQNTKINEKKVKKSVKKFGYVRKKAYISSVIVIDD